MAKATKTDIVGYFKTLDISALMAVRFEGLFFNSLEQMLSDYHGSSYSILLLDGKGVFELNSVNSTMLCKVNWCEFTASKDTLSLAATAIFYSRLGNHFSVSGLNDRANQYFTLFNWVRDIATYEEQENPELFAIRKKHFPDANPQHFLSIID